VRATHILLALAVLFATTGGSCSPPTSQPIQGSTEGAIAQVNDPDSRQNPIDVEPGLRPQSMEFVDFDTGYVLFADCDNVCRGALYVTFDGGRSWLARPLPVSKAAQLRLDVVDGRTVILVTGETTDWYLSTDSGRTFTSGGKGLPPSAAVQRGVVTGCADVAGCAVRVLVDGHPVPTPPPLRGDLRAAAGESGQMWAVGASGKTISTARSDDGGRTWQPFGLPLDVADGRLLRLDVSPDGADVWLSAGPGNNSPAVYVAEAAGWRLVAPDRPLGLAWTASAAVGDGVLAIAGPRFGYLYRDGRFVASGSPQLIQSLRTLRDGTLMVVSGPNDLWLGTGKGADRRWVYVRVDAV
jgi:hypothetical protein